MNTVAVFRSQDFEYSVPKETFINPCCFGDDLARWLMGELSKRGARVGEELGSEDFGWYFEFSLEEERHCAVIGGDGEGGWFVVLERPCGFLAALFGGRHRGVGPRGITALDGVLASSSRIQGLRWASWAEFRRGEALAA